MMKALAILFGILFIIVGILGFVPGFTHRGMLYGTFKINLEDNVFHLATGMFALLSGLTSRFASRIFFIVFGLIFAAAALLGFQTGEGKILGMFANNMADTWLHTFFAMLFLFFGFFLKR